MIGKLLKREEPRLEDIEAEEPKPMEGLDEMESNKMVKEKQEETLKSRSAVSPVIATVILVAVTITVAVAVAYWMSGIAGQYTAFEKVEIQTAICSGTETTGWTIVVQLKNSGTATSTITNIFINDVEVEYPTALPTAPEDNKITTSMLVATTTQILSGQTVPITVYIGAGYLELSSGTTTNLKFHSAGGMDYIRLVQLT